MPVFPFSPFNYRFYPNYINRNRINREKGQGRKAEEVIETKIDLENNKIKKEEGNIDETNNRNYNKKRTSKNNFANFNISAILNSDINTPILEILGIKLYLDDLIIIGLLFFLYKEDVQDELLFFILILLLLS